MDKPFNRSENGDRQSDGKFAPGNSGGPGRPRRSVERDYLAALGETCTAADWREICQRAVEDAKAGDAAARGWLAKYLMGDPRPNALLDLAALEHVGKTTEDVIDKQSLFASIAIM